MTRNAGEQQPEEPCYLCFPRFIPIPLLEVIPLFPPLYSRWLGEPIAEQPSTSQPSNGSRHLPVDLPQSRQGKGEGRNRLPSPLLPANRNWQSSKREMPTALPAFLPRRFELPLTAAARLSQLTSGTTPSRGPQGRRQGFPHALSHHSSVWCPVEPKHSSLAAHLSLTDMEPDQADPGSRPPLQAPPRLCTDSLFSRRRPRTSRARGRRPNPRGGPLPMSP